MKICSIYWDFDSITHRLIIGKTCNQIYVPLWREIIHVALRTAWAPLQNPVQNKLWISQGTQRFIGADII